MPKDAIAWQIKDADWKLKIESPIALAPLSWQLLWSQHVLHNQEGRWLHPGQLLHRHAKPAEVQVELPVGAQFQAACWGDLVNPPRPGRCADSVAEAACQDLAGQVLQFGKVLPRER